MTNERRKHSRVKVSIPIEWGKTEECELLGDKVTRLSIGGCFIQTDKETESGEIIFLRLWETSHGHGILEGRIIYQLRLDPKFPPIGIGVKFIELGDEEQSHLKHMLEFYNEPSETLFTSPSYQATEARV